MRVLTLILFLSGLHWTNAVSAEPELVVDVASAAEVDAYLTEIKFDAFEAHPERLLSVPRLRILQLPKMARLAWREKVGLRESVFYRLALSAVLQENENILVDRARLQSMRLSSLSSEDREWLTHMMARYRVGPQGELSAPARMATLLRRVDILPPSLVIVRGAIDSGWLQSRFAGKGQAVFGQWTIGHNGDKALNSKARVAAFSNPREALIAYMLNLNSHAAHRELRLAREAMRRAGRSIDGLTLAGFLTRHADADQEYVNLIGKMIRRDTLSWADSARLASRPHILFRRVDEKR